MVLRSFFCLKMVFVAVAYLYEECHFKHICQLVVEGLLVFIWDCHCWSIHADNCSKVVLAQRLSHRHDSVTYWLWHFCQFCDDILLDSKAHSSLPSFSFGFATPEERVFQRLPDSENLVSHRAVMSMLYLASSIATSAAVPYVFLVGQLLLDRGES